MSQDNLFSARIKQIDEQIAWLQKEKDNITNLLSRHNINGKIIKYIETTYSGKKLAEKYKNLQEEGFWKILGEDPNCGIAGPHYCPEIGTIHGTLLEALEYAVEHDKFYVWGGGGDIVKLEIITPI